jgi:hypothetical protein
VLQLADGFAACVDPQSNTVAFGTHGGWLRIPFAVVAELARVLPHEAKRGGVAQAGPEGSGATGRHFEAVATESPPASAAAKTTHVAAAAPAAVAKPASPSSPTLDPTTLALAAIAQAVAPLALAENTSPSPVAAPCGLDAIEAEMRKHPQLDISPCHHFAKGVYAREILIPAGTLLTGKIHKTEHLNIVSKGEIAVWTETEGVRRVKAPFTFVAQPGTRRLGYALEDTVWTTIHGTDETDLVKLEDTLIEISNQLIGGSPCLG